MRPLKQYSSDTRDSPLSRLSELQKHFLNLSVSLGVEGDVLAGTFLLMKDDVVGMEEMLLWMYDFRPTRDEIQAELVRRVKARHTANDNGFCIDNENSSTEH